MEVAEKEPFTESKIPAARDEAPTLQQPKPEASEEQKQPSSQPPTPGPDQGDWSRATRFDGLRTDDWQSKAAVIQQFLENHPESDHADQAKTLLAELKTRAQAARSVPAKKTEAPDSDPAQSNPEKEVRTAAWNAFDTRLNEVLAGIREGSFESAVKSAEAPVAAAAQNWSEAAKSLVGPTKTLLQSQVARRQAFQKIVGRIMRLETVKGGITGKVLSVGDTSLKLQKQFTINGETRIGNTVEIPLMQLSPAFLLKIVPQQSTKQVNDHLADALVELGAGRLKGVQEVLSNCGDHPLRVALAERVRLDLAKAQEAEAKAKWEAVLAATGDERLSLARDWKMAYEKTVFAGSIQRRVQNVLRGLEPNATRVLLVDFGASREANKYGLPGWNTPFKDRYTTNVNRGPGGMHIRTRGTGKYNYQGVKGPAVSFAEGDVIVVHWFNSADKPLEIAPQLSFSAAIRMMDMKKVNGKVYAMTKAALGAKAAGTSRYVLTEKAAGEHALVNVSCRTNNRGTIICDKIEWIRSNGAAPAESNEDRADEE